MALVYRTRIFDARMLRAFRIYAPLDGSRFVFMYRNNKLHRKLKLSCSELIWFCFYDLSFVPFVFSQTKRTFWIIRIVAMDVTHFTTRIIRGVLRIPFKK